MCSSKAPICSLPDTLGGACELGLSIHVDSRCALYHLAVRSLEGKVLTPSQENKKCCTGH